jgi:hypothetical protein
LGHYDSECGETGDFTPEESSGLAGPDHLPDLKSRNHQITKSQNHELDNLSDKEETYLW